LRTRRYAAGIRGSSGDEIPAGDAHRQDDLEGYVAVSVGGLVGCADIDFTLPVPAGVAGQADEELQAEGGRCGAVQRAVDGSRGAAVAVCCGNDGEVLQVASLVEA
jgi:hypothetical protein